MVPIQPLHLKIRCTALAGLTASGQEKNLLLVLLSLGPAQRTSLQPFSSITHLLFPSYKGPLDYNLAVQCTSISALFAQPNLSYCHMDMLEGTPFNHWSLPFRSDASLHSFPVTNTCHKEDLKRRSLSWIMFSTQVCLIPRFGGEVRKIFLCREYRVEAGYIMADRKEKKMRSRDRQVPPQRVFWHKEMLAIRSQGISQSPTMQQTSHKRFIGEKRRTVAALSKNRDSSSLGGGVGFFL